MLDPLSLLTRGGIAPTLTMNRTLRTQRIHLAHFMTQDMATSGSEQRASFLLLLCARGVTPNVRCFIDDVGNQVYASNVRCSDVFGVT